MHMLFRALSWSLAFSVCIAAGQDKGRRKSSVYTSGVCVCVCIAYHSSIHPQRQCHV